MVSHNTIYSTDFVVCIDTLVNFPVTYIDISHTKEGIEGVLWYKAVTTTEGGHPIYIKPGDCKRILLKAVSEYGNAAVMDLGIVEFTSSRFCTRISTALPSIGYVSEELVITATFKGVDINFAKMIELKQLGGWAVSNVFVPTGEII